MISIHAPARGATPHHSPLLSSGLYFNPRSREGSDVLERVFMPITFYFNPRSREGSDFYGKTHTKQNAHISIHAPARGATTSGDAKQVPSIFQSTLPRGERLRTTRWMGRAKRFQSTLPRGERLSFFDTFFIYQIISIHAPARGAT